MTNHTETVSMPGGGEPADQQGSSSNSRLGEPGGASIVRLLPQRRATIVPAVRKLLVEQPELSTGQVVALTGASPHTVRAYRSLGRKTKPTPYKKPPGRRPLVEGETASERFAEGKQTVWVERYVLTCLYPQAKRRGLTTAELIRQLLLNVVEDQLVDAVLDDGGA